MTVIVLPEPDEERLVKIASICDALNLQEANEIVWLMVVQATDASDGQDNTKPPMFVAEETADKSSEGKETREELPLNIWKTFAHADILNCGTV